MKKVTAFFFCLLIDMFCAVMSEVRVEILAPLDSVEEDGVFSIHCRVWELSSSHEVSILRRINGRSQRLSLNGGLLHDIDDRFFLANRQMEDGSTVYFLSAMNAKRQDAGVYLCKVSEPEGGTLVEDFVELAVEYFPEDTSPNCSPAVSPITVPCGQSLTLNCTSDAGNPAVDMRWYRMRTGTELLLPDTLIVNNGVVYSELTFDPKSMADSEALFICKITSDTFPTLSPRTCHVGPISVIWTDNYPCNVPATTAKSPATTPKISMNSKSPPDIATNCLNTCESYLSTPVSYWIFATVLAAILAFIFFVVVISLVVKLHSDRTRSQMYLSPHSPNADIYAEVENRHMDNRIYMALEKKDTAPRCFDGHDYVGTNNRRL